MISTAYGDTFKPNAAPPTSVYVHHVDSNERENVLTTTPSTYTVALGADLKRVATVQIGDVQLPATSRWGVDLAHRHFGISEPLKLEVATSLVVEETVTTCNLTTGASTTPSTSPTETLVFPPTVSSIVDNTYNVTFDLTLQPNCGYALQNIIAMGPSEVVPPARIIGARTLNYDVVLDATNIQSYSSNHVFLATAYANVLFNKTGSTVNGANVISTSSYLYVTPLTIPEWVQTLQRALDVMSALRLTQRYKLELNADTGLVELSMSGGDIMTRTTRTETVAKFTVVSGDVMWMLGFPSGTWNLPAYKSSRLLFSGARADTTPFVMRVQPRAVRTIQLRRGRYCTGVDLATELTRACTPLVIPVVSTGCTFGFVSDLGQSSTVTVNPGRYSPDQLKDYILNILGSATRTSIAVVDGAGCGGFTISNIDERPFSLDFTASASAHIANALGFDPVYLSGASSYTSTREAFCGQSTALSSYAPDTSLSLTWTANPLTNALQVSSSRALSSTATTTVTYPSSGGTCTKPNASTVAVVAAWGTGSSVIYTTSSAHGLAAPAVVTVSMTNLIEFDMTASITSVPTTTSFTVASTAIHKFSFGNYASHLAKHDLVRIRSTSGTPNSVLALALPSSTVTNECELVFGALIPNTDLDLTTMTATPFGRPDFCVHAAPPPREIQFPIEDTSGATILNTTLARPMSEIGRGAAYGPLFEQLGFAPTTVQSSAAGQLMAPNVYSLDPPPYVLLALLSPSIVSERSVFRPSRCDAPQPVLAKFIVTGGYARISEESTHVSLTSPLSVNKVTVAWLNPDGTLVDWNGANHSYSLLFRVIEGKVHGINAD